MLVLLPLAVSIWLIWRHVSWLSKQPLNRVGQIFTFGLQVSLLVTIVFNLTGRPFATFPIFYFFMLVGLVESVYWDVRHGGSIFTVSSVDQEGEPPAHLGTSLQES